MLIAIDAGHGGRDPGAVGKNGLHEAPVNLDVALITGRLLREAKHHVLLTRDKDAFIAIGDRVRRANNAKAEFLVSVHCNAAENRTAHGTETFRYRSPRTPHPEADRLARNLQQSLVRELGRRDRGVKDGNFQIIRTSAMPSALVELAFISNPEEEKLLGDPGFRERCGVAIAAGIMATII
jgi:N-acetylmuramoyl-L-alanine amidase